MVTTNFKSPIEEIVDQLFSEIKAKRGECCNNPVTGGGFVWGIDPIATQKSEAVAALRAREWFAVNGPPDAPPLPIGYNERESVKGTSPLATIVSRYARSWEVCRYDLDRHPSFYDYACGVMASEFNGWPGLASDPEMLRRFPPRGLVGLGPGLIWGPPKALVKRKAA